MASSSLSVSSSLASGCSSVFGSLGYIAKFYPYAIGDEQTVYDISYYESGYQGVSSLGMVSNVLSIDFSWIENPDSTAPAQGSIYGFSVTSTNFTVELTGYFLPGSLGTYTFEISNVNDGAAVFIGDGSAFQCGKLLSKRSTSGYIFATGPNGISQGTVELEAGIYYPVRLVFVNVESNASLNFNIVGPDGTSVPTEGSIFNLDSSSLTSLILGMSTSAKLFPTSNISSGIFSTRAPASLVSTRSTSDFQRQTQTQIDIQTTVITITSCSDNECTRVPVTTGLTTVTEIGSIYTTYCPLSLSSLAIPATVQGSSSLSSKKSHIETDIRATVITVTSCSDNKCTKVPVTTGLTTVTEIDSIYTTYCPLSTDSDILVLSPLITLGSSGLGSDLQNLTSSVLMQQSSISSPSSNPISVNVNRASSLLPMSLIPFVIAVFIFTV